MTALLSLWRALFGPRLAMFERIGKECGSIGRTRIGPRTVVLVNAPELVQEVLVERVDDFIKGPGLRVTARALLGDGLLTSEGEQHRERRKLVAPALAHQRVSRYAAVMAEHADQEQRGWRDGESIDIASAMMRLTLGIVGRTLFDADMLAKADTIAKDIAILQSGFSWRARLPFRLPHHRWERAARARLDATVYGMIRARRESGEDRGDLLSMLLLSKDADTGEHLSDREVRDEAMTLFLAGHETTAQALSWSWYLLARHPDLFRRLREEKGYGLLVFKEAMRLYPPAYVLGRTAVRDTWVGDFAVRKGEILFIAPWLLHRDVRYFQDPLRFDPERFRPEREAALPKFAYLPFGGGRRVCIGNQFALMEGQICLEKIAAEIDLELVAREPVEIEATMTLRPRGGIPVTVRRMGSSGSGKRHPSLPTSSPLPQSYSA